MPVITAARTIVTCPGRNFVTLKIETDAGISGVGDATLNGRELAVDAYLAEHVIPCLIGKDAHRIEDIWQYLYRGAYWRRGPVTMTAIAAVDMALWDIKAKVAGLPLYQLLGGACRDGMMVYGHANGETVDETVAQAADYVAQGYKAVRLQTAVPGVKGTYGVSKDKMFYEPADAALPTETQWATEPYLRTAPQRFDARGPSALISMDLPGGPVAQADVEGEGSIEERGLSHPGQVACVEPPRLLHLQEAEPDERSQDAQFESLQHAPMGDKPWSVGGEGR
ncbi:MAG: hypothetical protein ACK4Y4_09565, partial [Brevundimonas sp.]